MSMKRVLALPLLLLAANATQAATIDQLNTLGQSQFRALSEDLGAALSYKAVSPVEPLGITGFDIGVEVTATSLANASVFDAATSGSSLTMLPIPKLHLHKGLPFNIDVGGFYSSVPDVGLTLTGFEVRYAILEGGAATPAVAIRGTHTTLGGVDQLDFSTTGLELGISKGFLMLTPYAGVGKVWSTSSPKNVVGLQGESFSQNKLFAGANFNMGLMNIAVEADKTGDATTFGAKLGFRF